MTACSVISEIPCRVTPQGKVKKVKIHKIPIETAIKIINIYACFCTRLILQLEAVVSISIAQVVAES